jgi:hypothetical protein
MEQWSVGLGEGFFTTPHSFFIPLPILSPPANTFTWVPQRQRISGRIFTSVWLLGAQRGDDLVGLDRQVSDA